MSFDFFSGSESQCKPAKRSKIRMRTPKLSTRKETSFRYYAGFSSSFVADILAEYATATSCVLDPWNGSGTTTAVCSQQGLKSVGLDINPAVIPVAWARLARKDLVTDLCERLRRIDPTSLLGENVDIEDDGLLDLYFAPAASKKLRSLRSALIDISQSVAVNEDRNEYLAISGAALLLLARTIASILIPFRGTNPSWLSRPKSSKDRLSLSWKNLEEHLQHAVEITGSEAHKLIRASNFKWPDLVLGDSRDDLSQYGRFDLVISSPPYCTRIDYPVATTSEMLALGGVSVKQFADLRKKIIGTVLTQSFELELSSVLGVTAKKTLDLIKKHPTKAASTYYYKYFSAYFMDLCLSLNRLASAVPEGVIVLVVQNSFFKEVEIDLPKIISEQLAFKGFSLKEDLKYPVRTTIAESNPRYKTYRKKNVKIEHVLVFN